MIAVNANPNLNIKKAYNSIKVAPTTGIKTVTTTAAEMFAGASRMPSRYNMTVYNESANTVYWGPAGVTVSTGFPLLSGDSVVFTFDPSVSVSIYFVASANSQVRVVGLA